ncbi:MAG TPA: J domain-containing protein [Candidatus Saccharimonadales bacterium]|nr:J domain-containing protein [Candidatus Saccharimonadales bacterium]
MEYQDYYAVLGVPRTASQSEIKKAFRKLARTHHPDTNTGDAEAERRFKAVNEANAVLSDPDKRALYDRLGKDWEGSARAGAPAGAGARAAAGDPFAGFAGASRGNVRYEFHTAGDPGGFSDFFNAFFAGASEPVAGTGPGRGRRATGGPTFEEILAGMGMRPDGTTEGGPATTGARPGNGRGSAPAASRPTAEAVAEITLDEAFHGTTRLIDIEGKRLEVTIPKGADTGSRIRLTGKAPGGGDLHVVVRQVADPVFKRRGADLDRELPIPLREALLGGDVPVDTPKGRVLLTIPPGTQSGRTFRLTGRGLPRFKADGFGDVFVRVRVVLPTDLSDEARAAAERFLDLADRSDPRTRET